MKKITMLLVLMLMMVQSLAAKTVKEIINDYREENHAEYTYVSPAMMMMVRLAASKYSPEIGDVLKNVSSIRILRLNACKSKVKKKLIKEMGKLDEDEYQPMVMNASGKYSADKDFKVLVKADLDAVSEVVALHANDNDCSLIQVEGKVSLNDIQKLVEGTKSMDKILK